MALDRPASQPDRPGPSPPSDAPADPYVAAALTRAEAFASHRYWNEVASFSAAWRDHLARWPRDKSPDRQEHAPKPESAQSDAAAERVAACEVGVSRDIERAAADCTEVTWLAGFEFRLKSADRIKEKVADKLNAEPDRSSTEVVQAIPDAIRYTFCFHTSGYASGLFDIKGRLEASGYEMYYAKNFWLTSEYKGINSRWITPEGQRFEVQFHTAESFHAKHEVTHLAYERIRDPRTSEHERSELRAFQREVSSWVPVPTGARDMPDYKKEGF